MLIKNLKKFNKALPSLKSFSTTSNGSLSIKFHEVYVKELERIQKTTSELIETKYKVDNTKTPTEAYIHPYHSTKFPVYWSSRNLFSYLQEAIGTEPVSPHYESFVRSRRFLFLTAGGLYAIGLIENLNLNSFYGQHAIYELYTLLVFAIGALEVRYITQKLPAPRLTWFYKAFIDHEMEQFWLNWQDRMEENSRQLLSVTKEQIDFYLIHKEYIYIKKRSLSNFLENEKKNLDKHFFERTVDMLKSIEHMENNNIKNTVSEIADESMKTVLATISSAEGRKSLHESSLKSAMDGLRTGKMIYKGDPLLPLFLGEIKKRTEPLTKMTKEQEDKMFALKPEQRKQLVENDHRAKIQYLANPPEVSSGTVKNTEAYRNILSRMKKR